MRLWRFEAHLARVRWVAALAWIMLLPFIPTISRPLMIVVAVAFALANAASWRLLQNPSDWAPLRRVQLVVTIFTWTCVSGAVTLSADEPALIMPAAYLILAVTAATRYRRPGVIGASVAAVLLTTASFSVQVWLYNRLAVADALLLCSFWILLFVFMGTLFIIVVHSSDEARWRRVQELAKYRRERLGLTAREWEVLELLVQEFTYAQIAARLHISPRTVETHVSNVGAKLNAPGGRKPVERRAKEFGLFAQEEASAQD